MNGERGGRAQNKRKGNEPMILETYTKGVKRHIECIITEYIYWEITGRWFTEMSLARNHCMTRLEEIIQLYRVKRMLP
jgi:hypothetical protein